MLICILHRIDLRPSILQKLLELPWGTFAFRYVGALLDSVALVDLFFPLLESWPLRQVKFKDCGPTVHPGVVGDVCDRVLGSGEIRAFLQTGLQDGVETLGLFCVALDAVVGADSGKDAEVVCLTYFDLSDVSGRNSRIEK